MRLFVFVSVITFAVPSFACSGGTSAVVASSGGDATSADASVSPTQSPSDTASGGSSPYCRAYCAWKNGCGKRKPTCGDSCAKDESELGAHVEPAYFDALTSCFSNLPCGESEDACFADFARVDPAYPDIPAVQDCLAKRASCGGRFPDDLCNSLAVLTDDARGAAESCLSKSCDEKIGRCLRDAGAFSY